MESANVRVDEFVENNEEQCRKEPEDHISYVYNYEEEPSILLETKK